MLQIKIILKGQEKMKNIKRSIILSVLLLSMILSITTPVLAFSSSLIIENNEILSEKDYDRLESIVENNKNLRFLNKDELNREGIHVNSIEEYENIIEQIENLEVVIVPNKLDSKELNSRDMTKFSADGLYPGTRTSKIWTGSILGVHLNTQVNFDYYSSGSFSGIERFKYGRMYLTGITSITKGVFNPDVQGYVRNGNLYVTGRGLIESTLFVQGVGTVYTHSVVHTYTVTPNLQVINENFSFE